MRLVYKRIFLAVGLYFIVVAFSGYLFYKTYYELGEDIIRRTALLIGNSVNEILLNAADKDLESLTPSEKGSIRRLMRSMTSDEGNIIHILLISDKMKILLSSDKKVEGREYTSPEELENLQGDQPRVIKKTWKDDVRIVDVILPLKNPDNFVYGYMRLVLSQKPLQSTFKDLSIIFIPIILVFALLIGLTIFFIARAYSKPLQSIEQMAENLTAGDFSYRINYERKDEFTDTFTAINKSLEKVSVLNESYKKAEKRINALLQVVDESIILLDHDGEVSSYNGASVDLFQCPVEMMFENQFKQIETMNRELKALIKRTYERGENTHAREMTLWLPGGRDMLVRVSTFAFKDEHNVTSVLLTIKDQKLINELQHNLQRSMKFGVIASLASSISHEIKNPLSSMAIHAEILNVRMEETEIENKDIIVKSLTVIQNEVKRLNRIINQFFNLARIKKNDLMHIDINAVLNDVITLVQQQAVERHIKIQMNLDENIDKVYGDDDQLRQVFLNIILNAFQAIQHDGTTYLRTKQTASMVYVEIEDTGSGMSPEVQQRIFELYFTTKHDGGGIGMAICKNIIEAHDGRISFVSKEGKGTTFLIEFPRKDQSTKLDVRPVRAMAKANISGN